MNRRQDERYRSGRSHHASDDHPVDRLGLIAGVADVKRGKCQRDAADDGIERADDEEQKRDGQSDGERGAPRGTEVVVERFEKMRRGHGGQKHGVNDDAEDGIGHASGE